MFGILEALFWVFGIPIPPPPPPTLTDPVYQLLSINMNTSLAFAE